MDRRRFLVGMLAAVPAAVTGRCLGDWIIERKDKKIPEVRWSPLPSPSILDRGGYGPYGSKISAIRSFESGLMTVNELRTYFNLPPLMEGGNSLITKPLSAYSEFRVV